MTTTPDHDGHTIDIGRPTHIDGVPVDLVVDLDDVTTEDSLDYWAWTIIANVGHNLGGWEAQDPEWVEAAVRWRDEFHRQLHAPRPLTVEVYDEADPSAGTGFIGKRTSRAYRWRVRHTSNGEIMASGEGYADPRDRDHAVTVLFPGIPVVEVDE